MRHFLMKQAVFSAAVLCLFSGAASAAENASRPATKKDLVGTWELVSVRPIHDAQDPVFYPYQRYQFNADSSMKYMTSDKPFDKQSLEKFRKQPAEIDFLVDEKGVLSMLWENRPYKETAISAIVQKEVPADVLAKIPAGGRKGLPKKGDLTISYLSAQGKIAYQKVLTRVG